MSTNRIVPFLLLVAAALPAQSLSIFPAEYAAVPEGPFNSPNLPFANGTSRVLIAYDRQDLDVPVGASITRLGFRQDATLTTMDVGRTLQLEIRMGYSTNAATGLVTNFDANYDAAPTTVFGPAAFALPNLRDAASPLADGRFFVNLATPFVYQPGNRNLVVEYRVFGNSGGGTSFNYRLDRADFFSPVVPGAAGCQHSGGGTPNLAAAPVRIGSNLSLTGTAGPANSFALLVVAVGSPLVTPYPLDLVFPGIAPSCTGQLALGSLATLGVGTTATGGFTFSYPVPNQVALNDLWLAHQAVLLDAFAPGSVVVSNGVAVQVGIKPRTTVLAAQGLPTVVSTGTTNLNYAPVAFFGWQ
ncbi:MAG: hypothetical protein JNK15_13035 [Planctomycetes bacterium]|nr:hypothetical protein [Planctomycetota bacterium]